MATKYRHSVEAPVTGESFDLSQAIGEYRQTHALETHAKPTFEAATLEGNVKGALAEVTTYFHCQRLVPSQPFTMDRVDTLGDFWHIDTGGVYEVKCATFPVTDDPDKWYGHVLLNKKLFDEQHKDYEAYVWYAVNEPLEQISHIYLLGYLETQEIPLTEVWTRETHRNVVDPCYVIPEEALKSAVDKLGFKEERRRGTRSTL